jgi:predicted hydrocarbon binding protein
MLFGRHREAKEEKHAAAARAEKVCVEQSKYDIGIVLENAILVDKDLIADLYTGFEKLLRFVGGLLYTASKKAGSMTAKRLMERGYLDRENAVDFLLWTFVASGYADKVVLEKVETGRGVTKLYISVYNTLLGSRIKGRKNVDQPLAGFLAGWLESVYGKRVDGKETKCMSQGHDHCEFEIRIHESLPELAGLEGYSVERCGGKK